MKNTREAQHVRGRLQRKLDLLQLSRAFDPRALIVVIWCPCLIEKTTLVETFVA
jgi:hypothetical protein